MSGWSGRTAPSWGVISARSQSNQQSDAARACGRGPELRRPRHQPVSLAEGVRGHAVARHVGLVRRHLVQQRAAAEQSAFLVPAGAGQHDLALRRGQDGREVAAVGGGDGQGIEFGRRHDVLGEEAVLGYGARPARGVEAEQADEAPGRRRERARRHPADRDASVETVVLLQRLQGEVERCGRAGGERPPPDCARPRMQQRLARLVGGFDALGEQLDDGDESRAVGLSRQASRQPSTGRSSASMPPGRKSGASTGRIRVQPSGRSANGPA